MYLALVENYGDIRNKLNLFINLAPIAIIGDKDETSIFTTMHGTVPILLRATKKLKIYEFFGKNWGSNSFKLKMILSDNLMNQIKLQDVPYSEYIDLEKAKAANNRIHNSASVKQMAHFA